MLSKFGARLLWATWRQSWSLPRDKPVRSFISIFPPQGLLKLRADLLSPPLGAHRRARLPRAPQMGSVMASEIQGWRLGDGLSRNIRFDSTDYMSDYFFFDGQPVIRSFSIQIVEYLNEKCGRFVFV